MNGAFARITSRPASRLRREQHAVKGHEFGLQLSADDKQALIAFLRTL